MATPKKKTVVKSAATKVSSAAAKAAKPVKAAKKVVKKAAAKPAAKAEAPKKKVAAKAAVVAKPAKKVVAKAAAKPVKAAAKAAVKKAPVKKVAAKKAAAPKAAPKTTVKARPPVSKAPKLPADPTRDLAVDLARLANDLHCTDVMVQDVTGHSPLTRFMVMVTGVSNRQLKAVAQSMEELGAERNHPLYRTDADTNTTWVVLDLVDIMIHLFEPAARSHYDLETQFPDAKPVKWAR